MPIIFHDNGRGSLYYFLDSLHGCSPELEYCQTSVELTKCDRLETALYQSFLCVPLQGLTSDSQQFTCLVDGVSAVTPYFWFIGCHGSAPWLVMSKPPLLEPLTLSWHLHRSSHRSLPR